MNMGQHHMSVRKRVYKRLEPFPHPDAFKRFIDRLMYGAALIGPAAMIPQLLQIFETQDVSGQSLAMWIIWTVLTLLWLIYGILHKELPILLSQSIYLVFNSVIVVSILMYG